MSEYELTRLSNTAIAERAKPLVKSATPHPGDEHVRALLRAKNDADFWNAYVAAEVYLGRLEAE